MNKAFKLLGFFALTALGALVITLCSLGFILKKSVNTIGPQSTRTYVYLKQASLNILSGSAAMHDLRIANPKGCKNPQALTFDAATLTLSGHSIFANTIVIKQMQISGLQIDWDGSSGDNLKQIQQNLQDFAASAAQATTTPAAKGEERPSKKLIIKKLIITGGRINTMVAGQLATLPLPELTLTDLGTNGQTFADTVSQLFDQLLQASSQTVNHNEAPQHDKGPDTAQGLF